MNSWKEFKTFINANGGEGAVFCRSGLFKALPNISKGTIDAYRSLLMKTGFFEKAGRGNYRLLRPIPPDITWVECQLLINHKNLDYIESVHKRKVREEKRKHITIAFSNKDVEDIEAAGRYNNKTHCGNQMCCWGPEGSRQV